MKKLIIILGGVIVGGIILIQSGAFSVSDNVESNLVNKSDDKLVALSTFTVIADMVAEVGVIGSSQFL